MYAIREMEPDDMTAVAEMWGKRVRWAHARGIGPIRFEPLAEAAAALPLVLTYDHTVVGQATVGAADPHDIGRTRTAGHTLSLDRLVTDPDVPMPQAGPLSWIITSRISDLAADAGYHWVAMRIVPARLAEHLQTVLAWDLASVEHRNGATAHLLRRHAESSDAIRALVPAPPRPDRRDGARPAAFPLPTPAGRTS